MSGKNKIFLLFLFLSSIVFAQKASETFDEAMKYYSDGSYGKAISVFENIKTETYADEQILSAADYYIAESLLKLKETDGAIAKFEEFIVNFDKSAYYPRAIYELAEIYFREEDYLSARKFYLKYIEEFPHSEFFGSANYFAGETFSRRGNVEKSIPYFKSAIANKETNDYEDYSVFSLAAARERLGEFESAVRFYDDLLTFHYSSPLAPYAQMRIGICYFNLGKYDNVILELSDPLIGELPEEKINESKFILANAHFRLNEFKEAEEIYKSLLDGASSDVEKEKIEFGLAWVNFKLKDYESAFKIFDKLISSDVDSIAMKSLYWSAECKHYSGEEENALAIYEEFLDNYPSEELTPKVKFNLGLIYYNLRKIPRAERLLFASSVEMEKGKAAALNLLGEISLEKKDYKAAYDFFQRALEIPEPTAEELNNAALGLAAADYFLNQYESAIALLNKLRKESPNFQTDKVNFYLAESYFAKGKFNDALSRYNAIGKSDAKIFEQKLYGAAYSYFNLGDYRNSTFYFADYIKRFPKSKKIADAKFRLADSYYGLKEFEKSSKIYKSLFSATGGKLNDPYSYFQYGQTLFKAGEPSDAIAQFVKLQAKFPSSKYADDSQYLIGWIYFQQGKFEDAVDAYREIFDKYPQSNLKPLALYSIGDAYFNLGKYDDAIAFYAKLIDDYPNSSTVFDAVTGIQYCYVAKNQPENAVRFLDEFIANNPSSKYADKVMMKKAELYYSNENYAMAKLSYQDVVNEFPNGKVTGEAYYWLGKSASMLGENDEAEESFKKVIKKYLKTDMGVAAVLELGKIYAAKGEYDKAIELYDDASAKIPQSPRIAELLFMKATALVEKGEYAKAYEIFNQIIYYYDDTVFAAKSKIEMGIMELARGGYENAEILFKDLGQNRADDLGAKAQYFYGVTLFEQEKYEDALSAFVRVRSVFSAFDEWYTKSLIKLGDCYVKLNDTKSAKEMYRAALKRHKNDSLGKEAREKLKKL